MGVLKEFRDFAVKGNVIDLAVRYRRKHYGQGHFKDIGMEKEL